MTIGKDLKPAINKGGVESISIFNVEDIELVQYDKVNDTFLNLKFKPNSNIINIKSDRETDVYKEVIENMDGMLWVEHTLEFTLNGIISDVAWAIGELEKVSHSGVAAIVKTKQGLSILVGYSKKLKSESALKFKKSELNSARIMSESPSKTWILSNVDGEIAKVLVNTI